MKFSFTTTAFFIATTCQHLGNKNVAVQAAECSPDPLELSETMALKVEKVGSVPAIDTDAFSYNMDVMDNFDGPMIFFLDQKNGMIYSYDSITSSTETIFDMKNTSDIPDGLTLDWVFSNTNALYKVKAMTQGQSSDEVIVVFTSSTLPPGWTKSDSSLPPPGAYGKFGCEDEDTGKREWIADIYRPGALPACVVLGGQQGTLTGYDVFYKYTLTNGKLSDPRPFFVSESNISPGHLGGGIATIEDGTILWSPGDCTLYGLDGWYPPQLDHESCGKILHIDPASKGEFRVVAKGVRNSQQMRLFEDSGNKDAKKASEMPKGGRRNLKAKKSKKAKKGKSSKTPSSKTLVAFMDIGGVTAEEVNAISLTKLLDSQIDNFGWGRNIYDGKAREGTFYVEAGDLGVPGTQPPCSTNAPIGESGFVQPWVQFGRSATDLYYGISGLAVPTRGVDKIQLLWSEFNTGHILGTSEDFVEGAPPVTGYKLKLFDTDENVLENGLNDLVKAELGEVGYYRGDPRLFHFPDGHAGVFIERTGVFYKLTEMTL